MAFADISQSGSVSRRPTTGRDVTVLANRGPWTPERRPDGTIAMRRSTGGLVTALEPLIRSRRTMWVAQAPSIGFEPATTDALDSLQGTAACRLRYVRLKEEESRGYYDGFANEGLWPLCHTAGVEAVFRAGDFHMYRTANARFADAAVEGRAATRPIFLVQDYHLALVPAMLRRLMPDASIVTFWHIPWPRPGVFKRCPWARDLVEGLAASDLVGFQSSEDCRNFIATVESLLDATTTASRDGVVHRDRRIGVGAYPVGIDWATAVPAGTPGHDDCRRQIVRDLRLPNEVALIVGVDRLDYTKGLVEKLRAVERVLESRPEWHGRLVLCQMAPPSRGRLPAYQAVRRSVLDAAARINARFGTVGYQPIHLIEADTEPAHVYRLYRAADVCVVASLHDGMNLVAKEFVRARDDEQGVLVLSQHTGAARELRAASFIDPRHADGTAQVIADSLAMSPGEQRRRMRAMRTQVAARDASWWVEQLLRDADRCRPFAAQRMRQAASIAYSFAEEAGP